MTPGGANHIRFLLSACERGTSGGVIALGMLPILVILSSNERVRGRCRLSRGSQDRV